MACAVNLVKDVQVKTPYVLSATKALIYLICFMISASRLALLTTYPWMEFALSVSHHVEPALEPLRAVTLVMEQVVANSFINQSVGKIVPKVQALTQLI